MATKKPKPPIPSRPKPTPAKKKPAEKRVPVTSVTPRSTVKKPSAKQVAGTRKVVANLAGVTPVGRGLKLGVKAAKASRLKLGVAAEKVAKQRSPHAWASSSGEAKYIIRSHDSKYRGKGKLKNLKKNMEKSYVADVTGMPGKISKKNVRRTLPRPPIKKKK